MAVEFNDFQDGQGFTAFLTPTHALFLLAIADDLIHSFLHATAANALSRFLTSFIVNNCVVLLFQVANEFLSFLHILGSDLLSQVLYDFLHLPTPQMLTEKRNMELFLLFIDGNHTHQPGDLLF